MEKKKGLIADHHRRLQRARSTANCTRVIIRLLLFGALLSLLVRPGSGIDCGGTTANRETCVLMTLLSAASMFISNE